MTKQNLVSMVLVSVGLFAAVASGQIVNELSDYWVDLEFKDATNANVLPTSLLYAVYDRTSQKSLSPWREVTPVADCPNAKPNCISVNVPAAENLYVGRCRTKKPCIVGADCPDGICFAKLEEQQEHVVTIQWAWPLGAAKDRFNVDVRNLEFEPTATHTSTPTSTSTATPTSTPTATPTP